MFFQVYTNLYIGEQIIFRTGRSGIMWIKNYEVQGVYPLLGLLFDNSYKIRVDAEIKMLQANTVNLKWCNSS